ncbi:hypothetical protein JM81_2177 [Maribacter sp. MAR_2009_72]|nr:hypothetical protein JM81_2177 [Maribacter sp. MAR_2009_72]
MHLGNLTICKLFGNYGFDEAILKHQYTTNKILTYRPKRGFYIMEL